MAAPKGNKYAEGLTTSGRPRIYKKNEEGQRQLYDRVLSYFTHIEGESHEEQKLITDKKTGEQKSITVRVWDHEPEPPTVTGLALYLGFVSKSTLYDYARDKVFSYPIKRALTFVEKHYESKLNDNAATGAIFALKNFGWKDTQHIDQRSQDVTDQVIRPKRPE